MIVSRAETARPHWARICVRGVLVSAAMTACYMPPRNLAAVRADKAGCASLEQWAQEKSSGLPMRPGESSADDDGREAANCWHREGDDKRARSLLITVLEHQARAHVRAPITTKTGSFDDALCRSLAAVALSARSHGETDIATRAQSALSSIHGRTLDLDQGDRTVSGNAGSALSMVDTNCFFCAQSEVYGGQDREHIELLGRYAGVPFVKRDDGREQFLIDTKLLADGQQSPAQLFTEAMRRRGRRIAEGTPVLLATRKAEEGEELQNDAPLFHLTLHGIAVGDVQKEGGANGLLVPLHSDSGDASIRFSPKLLQRAGRDRRFVAPPDGIEAVVRYDGKGNEGTPVYRAVIIRTEDGVAEGP